MLVRPALRRFALFSLFVGQASTSPVVEGQVDTQAVVNSATLDGVTYINKVCLSCNVINLLVLIHPKGSRRLWSNCVGRSRIYWRHARRIWQRRGSQTGFVEEEGGQVLWHNCRTPGPRIQHVRLLDLSDVIPDPFVAM